MSALICVILGIYVYEVADSSNVQYSSSLEVNPYSDHLSAVHWAALMISLLLYRLRTTFGYPSTHSDQPNVGHELRLVSLLVLASLVKHTVVV